MRLQGQTALVTGGSRGIGRAVCIRLAEEGANVVLSYGHGKEEAEKTAALCREKGVQALAVQAEMKDLSSLDKLFEAALSVTGKVEILVNNAGITRDNLLLRMKPEEFEEVLAVNLTGTFYCMKKASRQMLRQRYGRIVNMSSVVGLRGNAGQVNYSASKAGVIGMTKSLAKELAGKKIMVNAVAPGMIDTDMTRVLPEEVRKAMQAEIPCGRIGTPEDVAEAVLFFALPETGYITGQVLCVDGGMAV